MGKITVTTCDIDGLYIIEPTVYKDSRGYFMEIYNKKDFSEKELNVKFVQENQSMSIKGVLRGMHYQKNHPQGKLIRVVRGDIFDVAIDLREKSKTFKKWFGTTLTAENRKQFYIPEGFAHGFLVLSEKAEIVYKCTDFYRPDDEGGVIWNDTNISINWPIELVGGATNLIISEKDKLWERKFI